MRVDDRMIRRLQALKQRVEANNHSDDPALRKAAEVEAMAAMAAMAEILTQYGLGMDDIQAEPEREVIHSNVYNGEQLNKKTATKFFHWYVKLGSAMGELCFCHVMFFEKGKGVTFIGMPTDVAFAKELYIWMRDQVKILANFHHSELKGADRYVSLSAWTNAWITGCVDRIWQRVLQELCKRRQQESAWGLVVAKGPLIIAYIDKTFKKGKPITAPEKNNAYNGAYSQGYTAGSEIPLYATPQITVTGDRDADDKAGVKTLPSV